MVLNVGESGKVPYIAQSQKKDSTFKKVSFKQPSTSTSLSCYYCEKCGMSL